MLIRLRRLSAWVGMLAAISVLLATTARAGYIPSQSSGTRDRAAVRSALSQELAVQRLRALGFSERESRSLVEAVLESGTGALLSDAYRVSQTDGMVDVTLRKDVLEAIRQRLGKAFAKRGLSEERLVRTFEDGLTSMAHAAETGGPETWLKQLGCSAEEARLLGSQLTEAELVWVADHRACATEYAGKVVGLNYKGILILLLPLTGLVWMAVVNGASVGSAVLGAVVVGLVFVLFIDHSFVFGSSRDL